MALRNRLIFVLILCSTQVWAQSKQESLQKALQNFIESKNIVGATVSILHKDGSLSAAAAGFQDREKSIPATTKTIYRLGSISKPVTAVAALQLVEKGKLSLDDDVRDRVPDWPDKGEHITLRNLLTHTSGIRHYVMNKRDVFYKSFTLAESLGVFKDDDLLFKPGERVSYSTHAFSLVARMVENGSNELFGEYVRTHIANASGAISLAVEDRSKPNSNRSKLYDKLAKGAPILALREEDNSWKAGGGGMESSAEDLARFGMSVLLNKLLGKQLTEQMFSKQIVGTLETGRGLGWAVGEFGPEHGGAQQGCRSLLILDTASQTVYVIMTNSGGQYDLNGILREVRRIWYEPVDSRPWIESIHKGCKGETCFGR